jgi:3-hydroxyacyl-[acyl-carrier-protein] dehydratase
VVPGDQLVMEVTQGRVARGLGKFIGVARVNGVVVAEAEMMCALREIEEK